MEKALLKELEERVGQLEQLAWSLYRALETYVTVSDLRVDGKEDKTFFTGE